MLNSLGLPASAEMCRIAELRRLVEPRPGGGEGSYHQTTSGASYEMTYSVTTGLSVEHSIILANSLG